jgi:hypothetical protein
MRQAPQAWRGGENLKNRLPPFANVQHVTEAKLQELNPISHHSCVGRIKTITQVQKGRAKASNDVITGTISN